MDSCNKISQIIQRKSAKEKLISFKENETKSPQEADQKSTIS